MTPRRVPRSSSGPALGTRLMRSALPALDRVYWRLSGGRRTLSATVVPVLVLRHTGARSGRVHETPLTFVRDGEDLCVVGSNWGQEHHPAWTHNLLAHPDARVHVDGRTVEVRAEPVEDEAERARLWPRFDSIFSRYADYRTRTEGVRRIRMFRLSPR